MTVFRNLVDEESREFWRRIDEGAREVESWPQWKRQLIAGERDEPAPEREAGDEPLSED